MAEILKRLIVMAEIPKKAYCYGWNSLKVVAMPEIPKSLLLRLKFLKKLIVIAEIPKKLNAIAEIP